MKSINVIGHSNRVDNPQHTRWSKWTFGKVKHLFFVLKHPVQPHLDKGHFLHLIKSLKSLVIHLRVWALPLNQEWREEPHLPPLSSPRVRVQPGAARQTNQTASCFLVPPQISFTGHEIVFKTLLFFPCDFCFLWVPSSIFVALSHSRFGVLVQCLRVLPALLLRVKKPLQVLPVVWNPISPGRFPGLAVFHGREVQLRAQTWGGGCIGNSRLGTTQHHRQDTGVWSQQRHLGALQASASHMQC